MVIKLSDEDLAKLEAQYPGINDQIRHYETASLPACPHCASTDTANVVAGLVGRTIAIAAATTRMKLVANATEGARHYCNRCDKSF